MTGSQNSRPSPARERDTTNCAGQPRFRADHHPKRLELLGEADISRGGVTASIPSRQVCVYEVKGDTLRICWPGRKGVGFPAKIDKESDQYVYWEYRRLKGK